MTQKSKTVKVKKTVKTKTSKAKKVQKVVKAKPPVKKEVVVVNPNSVATPALPVPVITPTPPAPVVATTSVVVTPPPSVPKLTVAEQMWNEIKLLPIQMFGLPNQTVEQHCSFYAVDPNQLFLTIRSSATLPSLEVAIAPRFVVELVDRFVIVKRAPQSLFPAKR